MSLTSSFWLTKLCRSNTAGTLPVAWSGRLRVPGTCPRDGDTGFHGEAGGAEGEDRQPSQSGHAPVQTASRG